MILSGGTGRRGWAVPLAVSAASPLLVYLIVKVAASQLSPAIAAAAASLPPRDAAPSLKKLAGEVQSPQARVDKGVLEAARDGLVRRPLAYEPLFIAARAEDRAGRRSRAIELLEEVRRRRPRHTATRMHLMIYYTEAQQYGPALGEVAVVLRKRPEIRRFILPELAKLLASRRGRTALAALLATDPDWSAEFFYVAAAQNTKPSDADAFAALLASGGGEAALRRARQLSLQTRVNSGDYTGARQAWLRSLPKSEQPLHALLFDGAFRGVPASEPFGWKLTDSELGRAEMVTASGRNYLDVHFFGGASAVLAEQLLALDPGKYRLSMLALGPNELKPEGTKWQLTCLPGGAALGSVDLARAGGSFTPLTTSFVVPDNCRGQKLTLILEPTESLAPLSMQIAAMKIEK